MIDIKRTWTYLSDSKKRPILLRTFRIWQRRPHQVRPITADIHQCCSCGTSYQGNYCPRCGQSASIVFIALIVIALIIASAIYT